MILQIATFSQRMTKTFYRTMVITLKLTPKHSAGAVQRMFTEKLDAEPALALIPPRVTDRQV